VGLYADAGGVFHGFLLSHGQYTTLDDPNAGTTANQGTEALGLNDRGQIVGQYIDAAGVGHGFLLSHGHYTTLDDPNAGTAAGQGTFAGAINASGQVVGAYFDAAGVAPSPDVRPRRRGCRQLPRRRRPDQSADLVRFENAMSIPSLKRLRDVFLDLFIASFESPPRHLTFDLDAVDDPAHGQQQLTFWHGYYDQNVRHEA
jgi:uncharacterized membrane protein